MSTLELETKEAESEQPTTGQTDPTPDLPESTELDAIELALEATLGSDVTIAEQATDGEAVAIASAIGAHLRDRRAAAAAAQHSSDEVERADPWSLAGRLDAVGACSQTRTPVKRGTEWKVSGRTY
jgi:hypothetical protein